MQAVALTVAGSDPSGGAGVQADLKTFQALGVYGAAVVTCLTVQNTVGVRARHDVDGALIRAQVDAVLDDLPVAAAKTGLLPTAAAVDVVAACLRARPVPVLVVDPVLVATSGDRLADPAVVERIRAALLPLATLVTPNLSEAAALTGGAVDGIDDMRAAARALVQAGARAALVTGGHLPDRACDVLATDATVHVFEAPWIDVGPTHGTGCTLSAAIAAGLAVGLPLTDAIARAKRYVTRALAGAAQLGRGSRSLDHGAPTDP